MQESHENKVLLDQTRTVFNDLKENYIEFLSSLKYDSLSNINDKKKLKQVRRRIEELQGDDSYDLNITKNYSF